MRFYDWLPVDCNGRRLYRVTGSCHHKLGFYSYEWLVFAESPEQAKRIVEKTQSDEEEGYSVSALSARTVRVLQRNREIEEQIKEEIEEQREEAVP